MTKINALFLGTALALGLIGLAHADSIQPTGQWKLSTGTNDAPCVVTLTADTDNAGPVSSTGDCNGTNVGHWRTLGSTLALSAPGGELIANLRPNGDTYVGKRVSDGRIVALAR
jgi:hypothetical protein